MPLSQPRILYGIHSISPYSRADHTAYGILKVIGSANLALSSDLEQLFAGSNKFAWAAESKTISTELTAKVKAYPGFLFQLFLGAQVTENAADTSGNVTTLANFMGTSVKNPTTGIASVGVLSGSKANLKFGQYVIKALTATTVAIQLLSDVDASTGTPVTYADDSLALNLTLGAITSAGTINVPELGLVLTGGSGTIAMVAGDTATFAVRPVSTRSTDIVVGSSTTSLPNFGAVLVAQKRATKEMFEIDAFNCVGSGLPISMEENTFSQPELKMQLLYDAAQDAVFRARHVQPA